MTTATRRYKDHASGAMFLLIAALLFGGASQHNALRLALVEMASLPVLAISIYRLAGAGVKRQWATPLWILAAIIAIPLVQLIPLPPDVWRRLPNRAGIAVVFRLVQIAPAWLPVTVVPEETLRSALALLPPVSMFLAVLTASETQRKALMIALTVGALASVGLGMVQVAAGDHSPFYLYNYSSVSFGIPIGFFANRNHQAILLACTVPVAALWFTLDRTRGQSPQRRTLTVIVLSLLIIGVVATRSRAGSILLLPALIGCFALIWNKDRLSTNSGRFMPILAVTLVVIVLGGQFFVAYVLPRFGAGQPPEPRFDAWPQFVAAASSYLPLGSGVGTFEPVYQSVEPLASMSEAYWNHAHNDVVEIVLETGWMGVGVMAAFLIWFARAGVAVWKAGGSSQAVGLARASTIVIGLILAHSWVDYPIRTEAVATVFAMACGLLAAGQSPPPPRPA